MNPLARTTPIGWTDHTINVWWGCTKISPACTHCYAETLGARFGPRHFGQPVLWGRGKPRFERLAQSRAEALKLQRAAEKSPGTSRPKVFINSMSDWLDDEVPLSWLAHLLETIRQCPGLDFQLLTKRPENWESRIAAISSCYNIHHEADKIAWGYVAQWYLGKIAPHNVWIGVTAENQQWAEKRIPHLLQIPAKVRFLSCEPLSGPIDLADLIIEDTSPGELHLNCLSNEGLLPEDDPLFKAECIHWVIAGGESGPHATPSHPDWFRSLRDQCAAAGVPFFFKQWGEWLPSDHAEYAITRAQESAQKTPKTMRGHKLADGPLMLRAGTHISGNHLDGRTHEAFPA